MRSRLLPPLAGAALGLVLVLAGAFDPPPPVDVAPGGTAATAAASPDPSEPVTAPSSAGPSAPSPAVSAGPIATAATEPVATAAASDVALRAQLARLVTQPGLAGASLGVHVLDAGGREVFAHRADTPMIPASTTKLVTAAAALVELGGEFRFTTTVGSSVPPAADGVVDGDLVLVGGGDPVLGTPAFGMRVMTERPRTPLEALADQVARAGVRHVTGRVVGDASVLPHEPEAAGWPERYYEQGDATRSSGLTVDAGWRLFEEGGRLRSAPAAEPALEAAASLSALLAERGVEVAGAPATAAGPARGLHFLGSVHSPPLSELLAYAVRRSDNQVADAVFRAVGAANGDGGWAASGRAVVAALAPLGLDWDGAVLADGSGLSRADRLSPRQLTTLDRRMHASTLASTWTGLMAVAGRSGTLRNRLTGTIAEGRVRGKTGSLADVRALAGTVLGPDGARYHFAVVANALEGEALAAARALQDDLALALAARLHGCERAPVDPAIAAVPGRGGSGPAPETALHCPA